MSEPDFTNAASRRAVLKRAMMAAVVAAPVGAAVLGAQPAVAAPGSAGDPLAPQPIPAQHPVTEGFVDVPGGSLYYWDTGGTGAPVVLEHTGSGSALGWPYQQPVLARAGYRVIGYSRRGYYRSAPVTSADQPASEDLLMLVNHLGLKKFHLIGITYGGYVATDFALTYPQRLLSLVAANSYMGLRVPEFLATVGRLLPAAFNNLPDSFREVGAPYRAANPQGLQAWEDIAARSRPGVAPAPVMRHAITTWDQLATLRTRTLLTSGGSDLFMPRPLSRIVLGHLPNASMITIAEAGHAPHWERPAAFNQKVLQFLAGARFPEGSQC